MTHANAPLSVGWASPAGQRCKNQTDRARGHGDGYLSGLRVQAGQPVAQSR